MKEVWISGIILIVLFYVFLILPQQSNARKRKKELATLALGDEVVTNGGLIGRVISQASDQLVLELAPGVNVRVVKAYVGYKLPPAPALAPQDEEESHEEEQTDADD